MDKQNFLQKFQYQTLETPQHRFVFPHQLKQAAVLIPLIEQAGELSVLLTKRASHLKHHAGQISFPGGKVEASDSSRADTALREAEEEIGLARRHVNILGQLKDYHTITGYNVTPIVAMVNVPLDLNIDLTIDSNEVAEVFTVPLSHFIDTNNHTKVATYHRGNKHFVYFMPYQHHQIWGATATILADLAAHLAPQPA